MSNDVETTVKKDVIFNNDPLYMMSLIGKTVEVTLVDNETYTGVIYVIDPIFKTLVIHEKLSSGSNLITRMVLHHSIKSLVVLNIDRLETYINESSLTSDSNLDIKQRKRMLKERFQNMCLNVDDSGDCLKIDDNIVILPPYEPENCICNSTIILERIQNILNIPFDSNKNEKA